MSEPADVYAMNTAYIGRHPNSHYTDSHHQLHSNGVSAKSSSKDDMKKRRRQIQFYAAIVVGLAVVMCLAFGLGFGFGYRDDDSAAASSRLGSEDPNKVPDVTIRVILLDIQWDPGMADTLSPAFKQTANVIENSMDSYFGKSQMAEIYGSAVVSELWRGSVGCTARIYLNPPAASTPKEISDTYTSIRNGSGVQKIIDNLKMGQEAVLSTLQQNKVMFQFDTLNVIAASTTASSVSSTMIATTASSLSSTVTETTASTVPSTVTGTTASSLSSTMTGTTASSLPSTVTGAAASSVPSTVTGTAATSVPSTVTGTTSPSLPSTVTGTTTSSLPSTVTGTTASSVPSTVTGTTSPSVSSTVTGTTSSLPSTVTGTTASSVPSTVTGTTESSVPSTVTGTTSSLPSTVTGTTASSVPSTVTGTTSSLPSTMTGTTASSVPSTVTGTAASSVPSTVTGTTSSSLSSTVTGTTEYSLPSTVTGTTASSVPSTVTGTTASSVPSTVTGTTASSVPSTVTGTTASSVPSTVTGTTASSVPSTVTGTTASSVPSTVTGTTASSVPSTVTGTTASSVPSTVTGTTASSVPSTVTGTTASSVPSTVTGTTASSVPSTVTGTTASSVPSTVTGTTASSVPSTVTGTTASSVPSTVTGTTSPSLSSTVTGTVVTTQPSGTTSTIVNLTDTTTLTDTPSSTTSVTAETTPADDMSSSIDAVFYIEDRDLTGNFSDRFSNEYLAAVSLIEEEIKETFLDAGEGNNLESVIAEGFWLNNRLVEVTLKWKELNTTDVETFQRKFITYHEARVQQSKSNISLKMDSFQLKVQDGCPHTFSGACGELLQALDATGRGQTNVCRNYADFIQCLYHTYQSQGLSLCDESTLQQILQHYSSLVLDIFGANIIVCDISNNMDMDQAVWAQLTLHSVVWNDTLKDKTSTQFTYLSDKVSNSVNQLSFNITVFEIFDFNRSGEAVTASAILSIVSYVKINITLLTKQLQLNLQLQQQSSNTTFLELASAEWVKDLTAVLKQTELWVWYNSKWNPVCQRRFPVSAVDVVCHQLGYSQGLVYEGLFKRNALELSNLTCSGSVAEKSLTECANNLTSFSTADCVVTNMNCFNTLMHYELVGGDEATYGYVQVNWDNKNGILCTNDDHSDAIASYLCRDINSTFYGGSNLQTETLQKPVQSNLWKVEANCYRPETDSTFTDCIQSGWEFFPNVTYISSSTKKDTDQPPFTPHSSTCSSLNTLSGAAISSDNAILDSCLVKIYCHTVPVGLYPDPFSNIGHIYATNYPEPLFFCRDNVTDLEAAAACKTLGYKNGGTLLPFNPIPWFGSSIRQYNSYTYQCSENKTIQECNQTAVDLTKYPCSGPATVKCVDDAAESKDWDLKLDSDATTVLLYYKGQWGTICDTATQNTWSEKEATVVCQTLGYTNGVPKFALMLPVLPLPHLITNVVCPDNASKLSDCAYTEVHNDSCINSYAAEVFCYNSSDVAHLELVGGPRRNSGYVKVTWQNVEGYLCTWLLDQTAATVMCHNFGFISGELDTSSNFTDSHLQYIWQSDFNGHCIEDDVSAETCRSSSWVKHSVNLNQSAMDCVCPGKYIALYCYRKVKLSVEPQQNYGLLLIYDEKYYYPICYDDLKQNQNAANAACREVTNDNTSKAVILYPGTFHLEDISKNVDLTCAEDAVSISDCATLKSGNNFDCTKASILCYNGPEIPGLSPENATEWRIEDSIVQIKVYGQWGTICTYGWTNTEAAVLCKTINSEYTIAFAKNDLRQPELPMWLSSVVCNENTTNINMCTRTTFLEAIDYCDFGGIATTYCFRGEIDVPKFILADVQETAFYVKGHTAVTRSNLTGYFCPSDKSVIENNADKLCKIMGYIGGQVSQEKLSKNEYNLVWDGSYDCDWDIPECFLAGNYTQTPTDSDEHSGNDNNGCAQIVPDILCFTFKVRLQNPELSEGFLLVREEDTWSGVCADNFTSQLAERFCSESGYESGNFTSASFLNTGLVAGFGDVICADNVKFEDCIFNKLTSELSKICNKLVSITCSNFICAGNCTQNESSTTTP